MAKKTNHSGILVRNFVFGVEDSLVSTVGLLSGVAAAGVGKSTVFLTGTVLILVEALSMGIGSFLSEESTEEHDKQSVSKLFSLLGSVVMFVSYIVSGFIPLFPYVLFEKQTAFVVSITLSLAALFLLGIASAHMGRKRYLRKALEMILLGGVTILAGVLVGEMINRL